MGWNFPSEYSNPIAKEYYLDESHIILKPFEIETFKGVTLNSKQSIIDVGNFLDLSIWQNDYSEHIEVSTRLMVFNHNLQISCIC